MKWEHLLSLLKMTSKGKKVLIDNFVSLSLLQVFNYLLPLLTFPYLVRVVGIEQYGLIAFAQAVIGYFMILVDYGFNFSGTRLISIHRDNPEQLSHLYSGIMGVKLILLFISFMLLMGLLTAIPAFHVNSELYLFTFLMVIGNVLFPTWFFQGMEKMRLTSMINIGAKIFFTISIFIFVKEPEDYLLSPLLYGIGCVAGGFISQYLIYRDFRMKFIIPSMKDIAFQFKDGWHLFVSSLAVSIYSYGRVLAMGIFTNNTVTGYYAVADKIITLLKAFPLIPFVNTIYPRLSRMYVEDISKAKRDMYTFQRWINLYFYLLIPVFYVLSPFVLKLIARHAYPESVLSLRILLIALLFTAMNAVKVNFLLIAGHSRDFARIHIAAGIMGVLFLLTGAWLFSYIGVSLAMVLIEIYVFTMTAISFKRNKLI